MTPKGRAIVTDGATTVRALPPAALIAFDLWSNPDAAVARIGEALGGRLPEIGRSTAMGDACRALRIEPAVWWLVGPLETVHVALARLEAALQADGAATDLSGGFTRLRLAGPDWRELLMIGGVFDAESADFGPDSTVGTLLHHIGVRYDVVAEDEVHIHVAPSYADDLLRHLRAAASRLAGPDL